jgi:hypothetical protein
VAQQCHSVCAAAAIPGVIAVFGEAHPDSSAANVFAQIVTALAILAPNASLAIRVPSAASPHTATAAALCSHFFGTVQLFRPAAVPPEQSMLYLLALRYFPPERSEIQELVALVDILCGLGSGTSLLAAEAFSETLRCRLTEAVAWAARRAEEEVWLMEALAGPEEKQELVLPGMGLRWLLLHGLTADAPAKVWLKQV